MAAEGACRKAAASLTSDLMNFTADDDRRYADELLPRSQRAGGAYSAPGNGIGSQPAPRDNPGARDELRSPLKGVCYKRMTGPGPIGWRPEHLQDLLSTPRKQQGHPVLAQLRLAACCYGEQSAAG